MITLFDAIKCGNAKGVQMLIDKDPSIIKRKDKNGMIALHYAAWYNEYRNAEVIKLLNKVSSTVNTKDKELPVNHNTKDKELPVNHNTKAAIATFIVVAVAAVATANSVDSFYYAIHTSNNWNNDTICNSCWYISQCGVQSAQ